MKAAYLVKINRPLKISDSISYNTLEYGQVLVKIMFTGVCRVKSLKSMVAEIIKNIFLIYLGMKRQDLLLQNILQLRK